MTRALINQLRSIVGRRHVLSRRWSTRSYRSAFRLYVGAEAVVVRPASLVELWKILNVCVDARCAIILQAANTGLTGGSSPSTEAYDRPVVIINVLRIRSIFLVADGTEAVCLPGSSLTQLEDMLRPLGREPHSVIGSTCLGASVSGGICNNSGGALIQRGPAYTELALFASVDADYRLHLINHLGIELGHDPEEILHRIDVGDFLPSDVRQSSARNSAASSYRERVRDISTSTPARFNADPSRLHEASGCAGKVAVFAVRVATYPSEAEPSVFYIGTNTPDKLTTFRRTALSKISSLPISAEYIHRSAFDIASSHGRDLYLVLQILPARYLARLFRARRVADALLDRLLGRWARHVHAFAHALFRLSPPRLPRRLRHCRESYEHHLILKIAGEHRREYEQVFDELSADGDFDFFLCTPAEATAAFQHRFAVAGAAHNYRLSNAHSVGELVPLDVALAPNDARWHDFLPPDLEPAKVAPIAYGHFFCHVFHLDFLVSRTSNGDSVRHALKAWLDSRGARYPAEHSFGQLYGAPADVVGFYKTLDPTNTFNPGVGRTSRFARWEPDGCR